MKEKLGQGSFGTVYKAIDLKTKKYVSIKVEHKTIRFPQLVHEAKVVKLLSKIEGFAKHRFYTEDSKYRYLVMTYLGASVDSYLERANKFSMTTVIQVSLQLLSRIQAMHRHNLIHRDLKPDNMLTSPKNDDNTIYLIDFGLAKYYKDRRTKLHIPFRTNKQLTGTARYASTNSHLGAEQSRRDDLENWFYVLMHMLLGCLPWQGIKTAEMTKAQWYRAIGQIKQDLNIGEVMAQQPPQLVEIFTYIKSLSFQQKPEYDFIRTKLNTIVSTFPLDLKQPFDWITFTRKNQTRRTFQLPLPLATLEDAIKVTEKRSQTFQLGASIGLAVSSNSNFYTHVSKRSSDQQSGFTFFFEDKGPIFSPMVIRKIRPYEL